MGTDLVLVHTVTILKGRTEVSLFEMGADCDGSRLNHIWKMSQCVMNQILQVAKINSKMVYGQEKYYVKQMPACRLSPEEPNWKCNNQEGNRSRPSSYLMQTILAR